MTPGSPTPITIPGYQVMLGGLFAYMSSGVPIVNLSPDYVRVCPIANDEVDVQVSRPACGQPAQRDGSQCRWAAPTASRTGRRQVSGSGGAANTRWRVKNMRSKTHCLVKACSV